MQHDLLPQIAVIENNLDDQLGCLQPDFQPPAKSGEMHHACTDIYAYQRYIYICIYINICTYILFWSLIWSPPILYIYIRYVQPRIFSIIHTLIHVKRSIIPLFPTSVHPNWSSNSAQATAPASNTKRPQRISWRVGRKVPTYSSWSRLIRQMKVWFWTFSGSMYLTLPPQKNKSVCTLEFSLQTNRDLFLCFFEKKNWCQPLGTLADCMALIVWGFMNF